MIRFATRFAPALPVSTLELPSRRGFSSFLSSLYIAGWILLPAGWLLSLPAYGQAGGEPTVSISDVAVTEFNGGVGVAAFTVSLSESFGSDVSVTYSTGDDPTTNSRATSGTGGCSEGEDFIGRESAVTLRANNDTPPSERILFNICGDTIDEFDETFVVNLTSASDGLLIADGQGRATIIDDDALPSLRINNLTITEGDDPNTPVVAVFTVSLSNVSGKDVVVPSFVTQNGTAVGAASCTGAPAVDFVSVTGSVTIPRGAPGAVVNVPVCGDTLDEEDANFTVRLSDAAENATIADGTGLGTIRDNDPLPDLRIADASAQEDRFVFRTVNGRPTLRLVNGTLSFVVSLSSASGRNVPFTFGTANGTAIGVDSCAQDGDFIRRINQTDTIPAGTLTRTVSIVTCANLLQEPNETLALNVTTAPNTVIADGTATGLIRNNDLITGAFHVEPEDAGVAPNDILRAAYSWVVPDPKVWRALRTMDLRLRDDTETILSLRWEEESDTFRLFDETTGGFGPAEKAGSDAQLASSKARLFLAGTRVLPGGPTAPDVTLVLALGFEPGVAGRTFAVEVAAADDSGGEEMFTPAGTLTVGSETVPGVDSEPAIRAGDLNADGKVNIQDATLTLRVVVGLSDLSAMQRVSGDMNGDGAINVADAAAILRRTAGLSGG